MTLSDDGMGGQGTLGVYGRWQSLVPRETWGASGNTDGPLEVGHLYPKQHQFCLCSVTFLFFFFFNSRVDQRPGKKLGALGYWL